MKWIFWDLVLRFSIPDAYYPEITKYIQVIGVKDLMPKDLATVDCLNNLLLEFMKAHPQDHFFIDELPVNGKLAKGVSPFHPLDLSYLRGNN